MCVRYYYSYGTFCFVFRCDCSVAFGSMPTLSYPRDTLTAAGQGPEFSRGPEYNNAHFSVTMKYLVQVILIRFPNPQNNPLFYS